MAAYIKYTKTRIQKRMREAEKDKEKHREKQRGRERAIIIKEKVIRRNRSNCKSGGREGKDGNILLLYRILKINHFIN